MPIPTAHGQHKHPCLFNIANRCNRISTQDRSGSSSVENNGLVSPSIDSIGRVTPSLTAFSARTFRKDAEQTPAMPRQTELQRRQSPRISPKPYDRTVRPLSPSGEHWDRALLRARMRRSIVMKSGGFAVATLQRLPEATSVSGDCDSRSGSCSHLWREPQRKPSTRSTSPAREAFRST